MSETYIALLRGINVGGKNKLPMKDLAALFTERGCTAVQTYIQSGNVIFQASPEVAASLSVQIPALIAKRFGLHVPVVLRTAVQLAEAFHNNPFLAQGLPAETLHVMFLADLPSSEQVAALDTNRSVPDAFIVQGRDVFLYLPGGVADTKLTNAYFDAKLATVSTSRNWKTVTKLLAMMQEEEPALKGRTVIE